MSSLNCITRMENCLQSGDNYKIYNFVNSPGVSRVQEKSFENNEPDKVATDNAAENDSNVDTGQTIAKDEHSKMRENSERDYDRTFNTFFDISSAKSMLVNVLEHDTVISAKQPLCQKMYKFIEKLSPGINFIPCHLNRNLERSKRIIFLGSSFKCHKYFNCQEAYEPRAKIIKQNEERREKQSKKLLPNIMVATNKKKEVKLECGTCFEMFLTKEQFVNHLKIHPPFICERCGKRFAQRPLLSAHSVIHRDPKSYICEICGKCFKSSAKLTNHQKSHKDIKHLCNKCPKTFRKKYSLRIHLKIAHGEGPLEIYSCAECSKNFKRKSGLSAHYKVIHSNTFTLNCQLCGQGFVRADYLKRHLRRHANYDTEGSGTIIVPRPPSGPVQCRICKKMSSNIQNLKLHIATHGTLSRFKCKNCNISFNSKFNLKRHEKFHEDPNYKFRCNICWKRWKNQEELDQHILSHDRHKYECGFCGESFARKYLMNHHIVENHAGKEDAEREMKMLFSEGLGELQDITN